jgi:cathepsin L
MIKNLLVGIVLGASLLGPRAAAADIDFDQGVDVKGVVSPLSTQMGVSGAASQPPGKTYQTVSHHVHVKGFHHHESGRQRDWQRFREMGAGREAQLIPDTFDLRPQLTQIEDQGNCGGCWAFSLTATNRDGHAIGGADPGRLSQEWLIENSTEAAGCNGGDFDSADALVSPRGSPLWDACPYAQGSGKCAAALPAAASITGWHMLGDATSGPSVQDIETEMVNSGRPVSIAVAAAAGQWEDYSGGIYNGCTMGDLDHMINIVGWDNQGATFDANGNLPPGQGVWILRNSWGTSWGEAGYMRTRMTGASGARCNNVAGQASYFDF